jgi:hypothetical protein
VANFRKELQERVLSILSAAVGPSSSAVYKVKTFEKKLIDYPLDQMPMCVVTVRSKNKGETEIGTYQELWNWEVHIYLLGIAEDYDTGELQRDEIVSKIDATLTLNPRLSNLAVTINEGANRESVFDSNFSAVLFDSSGQDGYYTFVSELYLQVDTQRN